MEENIVDYLLDLLKTKGADIQYGNEDVTQLEHALQCAELAEKHKFCLLYTSPSPRDP